MAQDTRFLLSLAVVLAAFWTVSTSLPIPGVKTTVSAKVLQELGGTLAVSCGVEHGRVPIQSIAVGRMINRYDRYSWPPEAQLVYEPLASIGLHNQLQKYASDENVGIDGHLDPRVPSPSFLHVEIHDVDCGYNGKYYCRVQTDGGNYDLQETKNLTVCDNTLLTLERPDVADPSRFTAACSANLTGKFVDKISYIELRRNLTELQFDQIAFANISEQEGQAQAFETFTQHGVVMSGNINLSEPLDSQIMADFRLGSCEDSGTFSCLVLYRQEGSDEDQYMVAWRDLRDQCVSNGMTHRQDNPPDPTSFSLTCYTANMVHRHEVMLSVELSVIPDVSPDRRVQLAFFDNYDAVSDAKLYPEFQGRGFTVGTTPGSVFYRPQIAVNIPAGTCRDTGLYRYKVTKVSGGAISAEVAEARVRACESGAVMRIKNLNKNDRSVTAWEDEFVCSVDTARVSQLVSLEISRVTSGSRRPIASINAFLNQQQPIRHSSLMDSPEVRDVSLAGRIDASNATLSHLGITARPDLTYHYTQLIALFTCKAVFMDQAGNLVQSMADLNVSFSPGEVKILRAGREADEPENQRPEAGRPRQKREKTGNTTAEMVDEPQELEGKEHGANDCEKGHGEKGHDGKGHGEKGHEKTGIGKPSEGRDGESRGGKGTAEEDARKAKPTQQEEEPRTDRARREGRVRAMTEGHREKTKQIKTRRRRTKKGSQ